jgi:predicted NACHT family NTPase
MARGLLSPKQIPILVRVSEYASQLSQEENLTFQQFLSENLRKMYPEPPALSGILLKELAAGNCLLLLDGLDKAANDTLSMSN